VFGRIPIQQLLKFRSLHLIGVQQPDRDALQPIPVLSEIRVDLIHDPDRILDSYLPAQAVRQQ
jgi:hypothetical protein